jgi:hypothetical protein
MTYLQVSWLHNFDDEPVEILSELDDERNEIRAIERFRDGSLMYAGPEGASGTTLLSEAPLPTLQEIAADPQFRPTAIDKETFERSWQAAMVLTAA